MFALGTHRPSHIGLTDVPLFVSRNQLAGRKTLPRATGPVLIDSAGYSELTLHGRWTVPPRQYVGEARRFVTEIGNVDFLAAQDWMCEPHVLAKTGLSVAEHQRRTVANYRELRDLAPDLPWVPVLQGWHADDYLRHADDYDAAGVDLRALPTVGVGSVCRRQHTAEAEGVIRRLVADGLRLHGFGFKVLGLARIGPLLASADSLAWSFQARRQRKNVCGSTRHKNCANCLIYALAWREKVLRAFQTDDGRTRPVQLSLPEVA